MRLTSSGVSNMLVLEIDLPPPFSPAKDLRGACFGPEGRVELPKDRAHPCWVRIVQPCLHTIDGDCRHRDIRVPHCGQRRLEQGVFVRREHESPQLANSPGPLSRTSVHLLGFMHEQMSGTGPIIMVYLLARPDQVDHRQDGYHLLRTTLQHISHMRIDIYSYIQTMHTNIACMQHTEKLPLATAARAPSHAQ